MAKRADLVEFKPLQLLETCPDECIRKLVHEIINGICGSSGPSYSSYDLYWKLEDWWDMTNSIKQLVLISVKEKWKADQFNQATEFLKSQTQEFLLSAINIRNNEIHKALIKQTCGISQAQLTDFDWKLKLVMASDKLASIKEPLLSLDLHLQKGDTSHLTSIELNKEELGKMINSLETSMKVVTQLST